MKYLTVSNLFLVSLLLASCLQTKTHLPRLVDIPTPGFSGDIDLYLPDSPLPNEEFIEIMRLDIHRSGSYTTRELTSYAIEMAKREGLDGVIVEGKKDTVDTAPNGVNAKISVLNAIGIKYLKKMGYITSYPREAYIFSQKNNRWTRAASFEMSPAGRPMNIWAKTREDSMTLLSDIYPYREYHLLHETKNWVSQVGGWGQVKARALYKLGDWATKKVSISYNQQDRIQQIQINDLETRRFIKIDYKYNKEGKIRSRLISEQPKLPQILEEYAYDTSGRLDHKILKKGLKGAELPFLRIDYEFYTLQDLARWKKE
ncbi:MAG: hypothetical protein AAF587_05470 [Bacteroidota bacterium]